MYRVQSKFCIKSHTACGMCTAHHGLQGGSSNSFERVQSCLSRELWGANTRHCGAHGVTRDTVTIHSVSIASLYRQEACSVALQQLSRLPSRFSKVGTAAVIQFPRTADVFNKQHSRNVECDSRLHCLAAFLNYYAALVYN